jgi:AraC-like DNA-binding protein
MSKNRQPSALIRSLHVRYDPGIELEPHAHSWAQLVYASEGVMTVRTSEGSWVVPPERALLVPPEAEHSIRMAGYVTMRTLYLEPELIGDRLAGRPIVVNVSRLIREFILHIVARGRLQRGVSADERMAVVLIDLLAAVPVAPLELRTPTDPRALRAAERIRNEATDEVSLDALAREVGASRRTLERLFQAETHMTLGRWRQLARLLRALEMLAAGLPVTQVALDVGYRSPSAFIQAFGNLFGTTPGRYFEMQEGPGSRSDSPS